MLVSHTISQLIRTGLDEDLHAATESQHQVKRRLLLNIVVGQSAAILELFARENQALLVWRNALLVLNLALDIVNSVRALDLKGDGLSRH